MLNHVYCLFLGPLTFNSTLNISSNSAAPSFLKLCILHLFFLRKFKSSASIAYLITLIITLCLLVLWSIDFQSEVQLYYDTMTYYEVEKEG